ncbi:MAG: VanZ family protein [Bifidobacteriaceae bacterium]|jgi:glycopeptide antibiotics resistance protein|nr:VanZ family protein [Bifidobacteriaceae bacterium]
MLGYFSEITFFSWMALAFCPILAALVWGSQVARRRAQGKDGSVKHNFILYIFWLYVIAMTVMLTVWQMPADFTGLCANPSSAMQPNFDVWFFLVDFQHHPISTSIQMLANFLLFIPLGVFLQSLFKLSFGKSFLIGAGIPMLIEVSQWTAVFGLFPCNFRTFDIDDLILNFLGIILGWGIARLIRKP